MQGTLEFIAGFLSNHGEKRVMADILSVWMVITAITIAPLVPYWVLPFLALATHPFVCWLVARVWARRALGK